MALADSSSHSSLSLLSNSLDPSPPLQSPRMNPPTQDSLEHTTISRRTSPSPKKPSRKLFRACHQVALKLHASVKARRPPHRKHPPHQLNSLDSPHSHSPLPDSIHSSYNQFAAMSSSIHSLLTHSALVTLARLAPPQLVHSLQLAHLSALDSHQPSPDLPLPHHPSRLPPTPARPSTTIEQLCVSSVPLPITSISTIWRLLNCIEWINLKASQSLIDRDDKNLYHIPPPPSSSSSSTQQPVSEPQPIYPSPNPDTFDVSNILQQVGDILSAVTSDLDVEVVFYHTFYPPSPETPEIESFNASRDSSESAHNYHLPDSQNLPSNLRPSPEPSNLFLGTGVDVQGDLRQVLVKADERGLTIGLICLLRQILHCAKRASTIEIGLHLTPLHSPSPAPPTAGSSVQGAVPHSICTSWKCVFDVSLTAPPSLPPPVFTHQNVTSHTPVEPSSANVDLASNPELDPCILPSIDTQPSESSRSGWLRISSNQNSELPICPEESLSKIIFEKLLGMKLSTGRLTSSGHSWKVTGIFQKGLVQDSGHVDGLSHPSHPAGSQAFTSLSTPHFPSSEPTVEELAQFAEAALNGKKAVFFAAERSIFAKHITTYLTSWNIDVSHMPYEGVQVESCNPNHPSADPNSSAATSGTRKTSVTPLEPLISSVLPPSNSTATNLPNTSIRSNNFIIIDDHLATLKTQLVKLRASSLSNLLTSANTLSRNHSPSQRPPMSRRMKSLTQTDRFEGLPKTCHTSFIYFTSISNFRKVQEVIRNHLIGAQWPSIPDVLIIPKPIGYRRILTALHTALSRPFTESPVIPIATSPSSSGIPHYFASLSHPLGASQLGRVSPSSSYRDVNDFDATVSNHPMDDPNHGSNSLPDSLTPTWPTTIQNPTPPGLRTPGTAPGTPGVPSPALLSHEALEYFSKAATENGGSSSTGVVLQSPDGRPQAMFFHHSGSSNRPKSEVPGHLTNFNLVGSSNARPSNGKLRSGSRSSSLNRPVMREVVGTDPDPLPLTLAQQVMANAKDTHTTTQSLSSSSNLSNTRSNESSKSDTSPSRAADKNPLNQTIRSSNPLHNHILGHPPPDAVFPHAIALAQYEAISPKTPTLTYPEGLYASSSSQRRANSVSSSQSIVLTPTHSDHSTAPITPNVSQTYTGLSPLTKEQQQILLNPRPLPMLRMPSIPVSLPRSISVTLPSPRLPPVSKLTPSSENLPESRSRSYDPPSSCLPSHRVDDKTKPFYDELSATAESTMRNINMARSTSAFLEVNGRRASVGDSIVANRLGSRRRVSRKPTTALVPPINVLIVEDNRINQTILTTFMRKKSVKFDVAMNGQEAVDKWRNGGFHLVLMDLQLPVKDGIEATKEIREAERAANINAFANTPPAVGGNTPPALLGSSSSSITRATPHNVSVIIVALTASSLDVDREVALAAGCNDFLTKPVSLAWLEKKLLEWGSMAWLSGFSRAKILTYKNNQSILLNQSLPAAFSSNSTDFDVTLPPPLAPSSTVVASSQPVSFTGILAQRKAKQVADHLHLRSDKARAAEDRKRANLAKGQGSPTARLGADDQVRGVEKVQGDLLTNKTSEDGSCYSSRSSSKQRNLMSMAEEDNDSTDSHRSKSRMLMHDQPKISLQTPTPERLESSSSDGDTVGFSDELLDATKKNIEQDKLDHMVDSLSHHQIQCSSDVMNSSSLLKDVETPNALTACTAFPTTPLESLPSTDPSPPPTPTISEQIL